MLFGFAIGFVTGLLLCDCAVWLRGCVLFAFE